MRQTDEKTTKTDTSCIERDFGAPGAEYRGVPFWAWNTNITQHHVESQTCMMRDMGFGGAVIHARSGLADPYMGDVFMKNVGASIEAAKAAGQFIWLYDEDRWPSGCAGGEVSKDHKYRQKTVRFSKTCPEGLSTPEAGRERGENYLLACYHVTVDGEGYLESCRMTGAEDANLFAVVYTAPDHPRYNGQAYIDTLNPEAVERFIELTYKPYTEAFGGEFGKTVQAIFTDEPQVARLPAPAFSAWERFGEVSFPWSEYLREAGMELFGEDILPLLPELCWEKKEGYSLTRYRYRALIAHLFRQSYARQIGEWCRAHGIPFSGHFMLEEGLETQSTCTCDVMRCYAEEDIPGIDILRGYFEYTTAKQCQSVKHQSGKRQMMSELYGVTNWTADFRDYLLQGNWQAALGVTVRVPHLTWVSMKGNGKRDYPATFGYQAPWYREFPLVEDHFARLNTVLTRGKPVVRVGVIHPIESFWLVYGVNDKTAEQRAARDEEFHALCEWLLFGGVDFDYINEDLLPAQYRPETAAVGEMKYDVVLVPDCLTLRRTTVKVLRQMKAQGVRVLFSGNLPGYVDAVKDPAAEALARECECIPHTRERILKELAGCRSFELLDGNGAPVGNFLYQERAIDGRRWFFLTPGKEVADKTDTAGKELTFRIKGAYRPSLYHAENGEITVPEYRTAGDFTEVTLNAYAYDSFLLCLEPCGDENVMPASGKTAGKEETGALRLPDCISYRRAEDNVCLLDMAFWSADGKDWMPQEEILRIDTAVRKKNGLPIIIGKGTAQPWATDPGEGLSVWLRYEFDSEIALPCRLAYEAVEEVSLNGEAVAVAPDGWYVDEDIHTLRLPALKAGCNVLAVRMHLDRVVGLEPMYLLGDFDVKLRGTEKTIVAPAAKIGFGDMAAQGLPFYGGNLIYEAVVNCPGGDMEISVNDYQGDLLKVRIDGVEKGAIVLPPYRLRIPDVGAGEHKVEIEYFGNRNNTFGSMHWSTVNTYYGPAHWCMKGDAFNYEYHLTRAGVMKAPKIRFFR